MILEIFNNVVYVKVSENKFIVKHIETNNEITLSATRPFTTTRLLIGEFMEAELLLKEAIKKVYRTRWLSPSPVIVIQPISMTEGGLSVVEERIFHELAAGMGARKVIVWVGNELTNEEVIKMAHK